MRLATGFWVSSSLIALVGAGPAFAQNGANAPIPTAPTAPGDPVPQSLRPQPSDEQAAPGQGADIVVTGSLIPRRDYSAPSAVVTMSATQLERSNQVTIDAALNQLPQMGNGTNGTTEQNRTGEANINLRGLGENRSLVLLDGRRLTPGDPTGAVDMNILPAALINSIETITGGSSATYGSDAMAGVVNIRLKQHFSGIQASAQVAQPEHGGGLEQDYNLTGGDNFDGGRGNAFLSVSYANRGGILRSQRKFFQISVVNSRIGRVVATLSADPPSQAAVNSVFGQYGAAPNTVGRTGAISFNDDGSLFTPSPAAGQPIVNYKGTFNATTLDLNNALTYNQGYSYQMLIPLRRWSTFGRVTHEIGDNINWFAEALFTSYNAEGAGTPPSIGTAGSTATVPVTNPFIPQDMKTILASRATPNTPFPITYRFEQLGVSTVLTNHQTYQVTTGLDGKLGLGDVKWNVYFMHGDTRETANSINNFQLSKVQALLNAPDGGASICSGGLNLFGAPGAVSQSCLNYIRYSEANSYDINQTMVQAQLTGTIFHLPAGDLSFALGGDFRREAYQDNVDAAVAAGDIPGDISGPSNGGSRNVTEGFAELLVPILADKPFFNKLEADLGYRRSQYTNSGGTDSYSANLTWDINRTVTLRGGYSHAIRAPSLQDLYTSAVQAQLRLGSPSATGAGGDPCDVRSSYRLGPNGAKLSALCVALGVPAAAANSFTSITQTVFGTTTGNPDLKNENADTITGGIVIKSPFSSPWLSRLRGSVDFYDITIHQAIGQLPLTTALARCYNLDGVSNPGYSASEPDCAFFPRDPATGLISRLTVPELNLAKYRTRGIDFQLDWGLRFDDIGLTGWGDLDVNMVGTYLMNFDIQQVNPGPTLDYAGTTQSPIDPNGRSSVLPHWKSVVTVTHSIGKFNSSVTWRFIGPTQDVSVLTTPTTTVPGVRAYSYFDLSLGYTLFKNTNIRFGVNNLFDKQPPIIAATLGNTDTETYDVIGRSYYLGIRTKF